ncbi:hypothetical protein C8R46DRAFT_1309493 [Mycena filopes]|nr:hypothetical protein C8R46DRAFT_1309493 [Mycena filopes]
MPHFGSSNTNEKKLDEHNRIADAHAHGYGTAQNANIDNTMQHVEGAGVGGGRHHQHGMEPGMNQGGMGAGTHMQQSGMQQGGMGTGGMGTGAMGAGTGAGGAGGIPDSGNMGATQHHGGSGKIEQKVGKLVGSKTLQAKGLEKEREAQAMKVQSGELAEAERLEQEAGQRRERAVAHGAHPDNRHVGGMGGAGGI